MPKTQRALPSRDGSPARAPVCRGLATYPLEERHGRLYLNLDRPGGAGARSQQTYHLRVVSNRNVATFIKELVLEPVDSAKCRLYARATTCSLISRPTTKIEFREFDIPEPFAQSGSSSMSSISWPEIPSVPRRNNYSLASNQKSERILRFNVRIATPPPGQDCPPGVGSSYMFTLKPGDTVTAIGPFGDFHIKPTRKKWSTSAAAPAWRRSARTFPIFWKRRKPLARSASGTALVRGRKFSTTIIFLPWRKNTPTFSFHLALSSPLPEDHWTGLTGFIHEVVFENYLHRHENPKAVEYYLCGPPMMIKSCCKMLAELGVPARQISFDEF